MKLEVNTLLPNSYNFQCANQVGKYIFGNLTLGFDKKPNLFHRWMTRLLLGWIWKDERGNYEMTDEEIEKLKAMCQRQALLLGYASAIMFKMNDFMGPEDRDRFKWFKKAMDNLFYLDKPLPEMP